MPAYVPLPGSTRTLLPNSRPAGPVDSSEIASLTVRVRSQGDPDALAKKAYELASTPLKDRKYLTHEELEKQPHRQKSTMHNGPGGQNGVASTEFAARYNFPANEGGTALDGTGQTIAFIELGGGYRSSDLKVFFTEIGGKARKISSVSVDHAGNDPTTADSDDGEVMLDIEVAAAVAPKAKFVVYFAPNNGDKGFIDAINAAVHDSQRKPDVISISWGGPEVSSDRQGINAYHQIFAAAGALGITVCVASGDHGTADLDSGHWDGKIHVDHPSCDDLVLSCGGTHLNQATKKNVGFLNPFLYANVGKGITHDVISGTNAIKGTIKGYSAGVGWDACTGLGTPDGSAILKNLP